MRKSHLITSSEGIFLQIKVGEGTQVEKFQTFPFMFVEAEKVYPFDFRGGWNDAKVDFDILCAPFYRGRCVAGVVAAVALFPVHPVLLQAMWRLSSWQ